jgi:hypothetical protein
MKNIIQFSFLFFAGLLFLGSCNEDNDALIPDFFEPYIGKWEVLSGMENVKYLVFTDDKNCIKLKQYAYEHKSKETSIFQATNGQIIIYDNNYYNQIYNTRISRDTLYLTGTGEEVIALKEPDAPDPEDWTGSITIQSSFPAPINDLTDIGFDGTSLWYGNAYNSNYLYKINRINGNLDSIPTTLYAWAIEFANPYLWVSSNGGTQIHSVNKTTGSTIAGSTALGPWIYGIAWDGQYF